MSSNRVIRVLKRINDVSYIKYLFRKYYGKIILTYGLANLQKYHNGKNKDFKNFNNKKLTSFIKYAYRNSEYYKQLLDRHKISMSNIIRDWDKIPLLNKGIIRQEKDNILTISKSKNYVGFLTTGGSTGQPLGFHTMGGYDAEHQEFLFKQMGYRPGDKILAMDGTLIPDELVNQNIYWTEKNKSDLPYGSIALSSQYLNGQNYHHYIAFLKSFRPIIIRGYPSFIDSIATFILKNKIDLGLQLKGIELTSESYYDYQISNIRAAFGSKVYTQYGHAEASVFGYSIDDTLLIYCSPFYGYTEVIGEDGVHVKQGEIGEVVVTGFNNYATPFIRYQTGDLAEYDGEENGIVKLKCVFGRTQDYIYTRSMEKVLLTAIVFGRHYKAFDNIEKWQIIQDEPGKIVFKIIKSTNFTDEDQLELQDNFIKIANIEASFEFVETLSLTQRGKSKFLIQNISV